MHEGRHNPRVLGNDNTGNPSFQIFGDSGISYAYFTMPNFYFENGAGSAHWLTITNSGAVAVGTASPPSYAFYVAGASAGLSAWNNVSDGRLKRDVVEIPDALERVQRLRGVRFQWRPPAERGVGKDLVLPLNTPQMGFIAQEVAAVAPEAVTVPKAGSTDPYTVREGDLVPLLVEAIKTLEAQSAVSVLWRPRPEFRRGGGPTVAARRSGFAGDPGRCG